MDMKKLLEAVTKFAGEPEQKPGDQVRGTDVAKKDGKDHPFKGQLVGDSKDNMLKGLSQVAEEKGLEWDLAEAYANFMEDDIGVEPKRPGRKSDRPRREYTKHGKPSKRYTTVEEGWNTGNDRVSLPDSPHTYWSGTGPLQKEYDALYAELVPSQGKADTIEGEVLRASSKIVYRHYNDGDEFNEASFDQLTPYIGQVTSYDDLAHKAIEFALKANGNYTPNPDWDSLDVMDYGPAEEEEYDDEDEEDDWYDDEEVDEGRGDSKGLHKKVTIVKGRDAGKTGYVRQIKTDKLRNRVYLDLDLEDGGQAVVLKQDVRLVKDLAESYTGRETKDGVWRVFKDGQAVAAAGPFKSAEEANSWIKKQNQGVAEARTTWNNDFYVYDPKTKAVKKKFRTHRAAKQYAEANGLKVASAEYYHDTVSKEVDEGWESGPEERSYRSRGSDPDDAYDAMRQEKLDAEAERQQAQRPQEKYYTLTGRGPNMEPNYAFPGEYDSLDAAVAARKELMADPKTPNPRMIGINTRTRYLDEHWDQEGYDPRGQNPELAPGQKALKGKPVKAKDAGNLAQDALTKAFGGTAKDLTNKLSIRKGVSEGIESGDPVESAVLSAVQELIQQGHTEVAPEVITNMVVAATSQPFLLKDLVDVNNNSAAVQHYVDSINPTKVKFSSDILTVKNENPVKEKQASQTGVANMASRAANRPRLGEASTPLRDREDYTAKSKALQDIQMDPSTGQDPQLSAELARRKAELVQQAKQLGISESRAHKIIANKLKQIELQRRMGSPESDAAYAQHVDRAKKSNAEYVKNTPNTIYKREVDEAGANNPAQAATPTATMPATDPAAKQQAAKVAQATNALKSATGATAPAPTIAKALDAATQGKSVGATDMKALEPMLDVVGAAAQDPKLANQFKTLASQAKQVQQTAAHQQPKV